MKCVGNSEVKSLGEIERKTYGTGGLVPLAHGIKIVAERDEFDPPLNADYITEEAPHTTNGVPVMRDGCMSSLMHDTTLPPQF